MNWGNVQANEYDHQGIMYSIICTYHMTLQQWNYQNSAERLFFKTFEMYG